MEINRDRYLKKLIERKHNGLIKVITGLRRSGKSYLLNKIFFKHLIAEGVDPNNIIKFAFDYDEDIDKLDKYYPAEPTKIYSKQTRGYVVNSKKFRAYLKDVTNDKDYFYILLDEVQFLENFVFTLNGLLGHENFDTYVTGSNSKMLSKDIITEFRGRGDKVHVYPLSFREFFESQNLSFGEAYSRYQFFGGLPYVVNIPTDEMKSEYLKNLFKEIYIKDIVERNGIKDKDAFERLLNVLSSSIGSYTNPSKMEKTFKSEMGIVYDHETIKDHIECLKDAFLLDEALRYNIKGRKYIGSNSKYYFTDIGLRNALLNFRQNEPTHIMENIIYNELIIRGYSVDVGIVESYERNENGNVVTRQLETDFVCNKFSERMYIQSAYSLETAEKLAQEQKSLLGIKDSFRKIIIVNDSILRYMTEEGVEVISLKEWLLN